MRLLIAGGGTGGHLFPGITIAQAIKNKEPETEILFVGSSHRIESTFVKEVGFNFTAITTSQLGSTLSFKNILFFCSLIVGIIQSIFILLKFRPTVILGLGGYISVAPLLAGVILRVPAVIHEQNFSPGRANKFLSGFVNKVALSFESSISFFDKSKSVFTGNFVRANIENRLSRREALQQLGLKEDKFTLLLVGGSRGAHKINMVMSEGIELLKKSIPLNEFQIIHLTGSEDEKQVKDKYTKMKVDNYTTAFLHDMGVAYSIADLAISRGGATTMTEIIHCGLPAIIIPYPYAVRDHQAENARFLERHNVGILILEEELSAEKLVKRITGLYTDRNLLKSMAENSRRLGKKGSVEIMTNLLKELSDARK